MSREHTSDNDLDTPSRIGQGLCGGKPAEIKRIPGEFEEELLSRIG